MESTDLGALAARASAAARVAEAMDADILEVTERLSLAADADADMIGWSIG